MRVKVKVRVRLLGLSPKSFATEGSNPRVSRPHSLAQPWARSALLLTRLSLALDRLCTSVNEVVCHGIPDLRELQVRITTCHLPPATYCLLPTAHYSFDGRAGPDHYLLLATCHLPLTTYGSLRTFTLHSHLHSHLQLHSHLHLHFPRACRRATSSTSTSPPSLMASTPT